MAKAQRIILGLVGKPGSGKTTAARYLARRHGFYHYEGSDGLREHAQRHGALLFTPEDYHIFHDKLQKKLGDDILAQTLLSRSEPRLVFAGMRALANAQALQAAGGLIVALDCPLEQRFARVDHNGLKYPKEFADFQQAEEDVVYSPYGFATQIKQIMELADITIDTSKSLDETQRHIDELIARLSGTVADKAAAEIEN